MLHHARGPQTYATLKVYQGVPKLLVMLATGHQTEAQFNVHLSIDEEELTCSSRARRAEAGTADKRQRGRGLAFTTV